LMFKLFPGHSMPAALWLGSVLALIGAVISFSRINRKA
jgi:DHA2 family multidrug resistance protein-like MFS transporter